MYYIKKKSGIKSLSGPGERASALRTWCKDQYKRTTYKPLKDANGEAYRIETGYDAFRRRCERDPRYLPQLQSKWQEFQETTDPITMEQVDEMCKIGLEWRAEAKAAPESNVSFEERRERFSGRTVVQAAAAPSGDVPLESHPQYNAMVAAARRRDELARAQAQSQASSSTVQVDSSHRDRRRRDSRSPSRARSRREDDRRRDRREDRRDDRRDDRREDRHGDRRGYDYRRDDRRGSYYDDRRRR